MALALAKRLCHGTFAVAKWQGADLTKIDPKQDKPIEILRDILEPSFRINEKYQSYVFELKSGKLITGLIVAETPEVVKVLENPLLKVEPLVLKKSSIAERKKSPTSIMPKGLLDELTHEEILDLIAYVAAKGDVRQALFQGGHDHGH
jgi:putative heme-binding domain-containing protein